MGAVILHSPLMSGMRVAFPATKRTWFFDAFPSIDKVPKIQSPVLVIHGTEDEVIDFSHGMTIYEKCPKAVDPLWVEGAGHNDVEMYSQYLDRLKDFVSVELVNWQKAQRRAKRAAAKPPADVDDINISITISRSTSTGSQLSEAAEPSVAVVPPL